jgi:hypothetical protein
MPMENGFKYLDEPSGVRLACPKCGRRADLRGVDFVKYGAGTCRKCGTPRVVVKDHSQGK